MLLTVLVQQAGIWQKLLFQINQCEESSKITINAHTTSCPLHLLPITTASTLGILFVANIRKNEWMVVLKVVWVNCGQVVLRGDNKFETENISSFKKRTVGHFSAIFVVNFYILIRQGLAAWSHGYLSYILTSKPNTGTKTFNFVFFLLKFSPVFTKVYFK